MRKDTCERKNVEVKKLKEESGGKNMWKEEYWKEDIKNIFNKIILLKEF